MSEMPERIWIDNLPNVIVGCYDIEPFEGFIEYVRADRIEELEAERDLLAEKLERAVEGLREAESAPEPDHHVPQFRHVMDVIGTTLAQITGETDDHTD